MNQLFVSIYIYTSFYMFSPGTSLICKTCGSQDKIEACKETNMKSEVCKNKAGEDVCFLVISKEGEEIAGCLDAQLLVVKADEYPGNWLYCKEDKCNNDVSTMKPVKELGPPRYCYDCPKDKLICKPTAMVKIACEKRDKCLRVHVAGNNSRDEVIVTCDSMENLNNLCNGKLNRNVYASLDARNLTCYFCDNEDLCNRDIKKMKIRSTKDFKLFTSSISTIISRPTTLTLFSIVLLIIYSIESLGA